MSRTTLILEDACMEEVRRVARAENRKLSDLVNELLVEGLQRRKRRIERTGFDLPSFSMGEPRVNLGDRDALESFLES